MRRLAWALLTGPARAVLNAAAKRRRGKHALRRVQRKELPSKAGLGLSPQRRGWSHLVREGVRRVDRGRSERFGVAWSNTRFFAWQDWEFGVRVV